MPPPYHRHVAAAPPARPISWYRSCAESSIIYYIMKCSSTKEQTSAPPSLAIRIKYLTLRYLTPRCRHRTYYPQGATGGPEDMQGQKGRDHGHLALPSRAAAGRWQGAIAAAASKGCAAAAAAAAVGGAPAAGCPPCSRRTHKTMRRRPYG